MLFASSSTIRIRRFPLSTEPATDSSGGELATQIEADRELHDTPIIFLTALVTHGEAQSGLHIQGHPFVAKPISIPELIDAIEKHLPARAEC